MMEIMAIANQKGGVGKTTTAVTLAHGLANHGIKTLLVDLDPQGHVAECLGLKKSPGLFQLLVQEIPLQDVVVEARKNLFIVPGDKTTERVKRYLASGGQSSTKIFENALKDAPYQVVLFDCAPSYDILHIAALVASNLLLIPTKLDHLATDGVNEILHSAAELKRSGESKISLIAVLPTFFERVTKETSEQLRVLADKFGKLVWPPIPDDVRAREAVAYGQTLWEYATWSACVVGYERKDGTGGVGGYKSTLERIMHALGLESRTHG